MGRHMDAAAIVIGAGIAGAAAAWALSEYGPVVLVEREAHPGHHATGRSASVMSQTSGHRVVCALAAASRTFLESPPPGFADHPLLSPRGLLWIGADAAQLDRLAEEAGTLATVRRLSPAEVVAVLPCVRAEAVGGGGVFEPEAMSIDTDALLHGFLRGLRHRHGRVITGFEVTAVDGESGEWTVNGSERLRAPIVVDAAGAWGDAVAAMAGVRPLGLQPMRRTACIVALDDVDPRWPLTMDVAGRLYFEPDAGGLLLSPADETPSEPCDARPDEIDVAIALDRLGEMTTLETRSVRRAWAGLRTFAPDRVPVVGEAPDSPGFWWLVGQGGGGIKTAPAMAMSLAALVRGEPLPSSLSRQRITDKDLSPARFTTCDQR